MTETLNYSSSIKNDINFNINFLLSAPKNNSKVIHTRINKELYNMVISKCVKLNITISEYLKTLIIKDIINNTNPKITIKTEKEKQKQNEESEKYITKEEKEKIIEKINNKKIKREIEEMLKESRELLKRAIRVNKKYKTQKTLYTHEKITIINRLEALTKRLERLLKQKIPKTHIDDINQIANTIQDIQEII